MENDSGTDRLRKLAPNWTLSGDEQLLNILENTHQCIITKCQEVNTKLNQMTSDLDDASISLQNVNNKFMALSNSQFIESRVYDDDDEISTDAAPPKEQITPKADTELSMLRQSIAVIESFHESVTILRDSDTESESDDDEISRTVLKPKDMYADRPLPHIIGTQAWKNKWHAGLLPEDSDSDSMVSKRDTKDSDQYSESDQEMEEDNIQTNKLRIPDSTISETSSELPSEQDILTPPPPKQTASDIAAELAKRLGGQPSKSIEPEPELPQQKPIVRKVYKPEQPVTGQVFSDEPPPIDDYVSEDSDNGDIFAELHKHKPYENKKSFDRDPASDLFGFNQHDEDDQGDDIFKDITKEKHSSQQTPKIKPHISDENSKTSSFVKRTENKQQKQEEKEEVESKIGVKKPVGGISLFGNNEGAESIGAAILKRNRKSSSSSIEQNSDAVDEKVSKNNKFHEDLFNDPKNSLKNNKTVKDDNNLHKNVINEIFEKNKQKANSGLKFNAVKNVINTSKDNGNIKLVNEKIDSKTTKTAKIDLFSDNLFDDIDDIFTSDVKIPKKDDKISKSLFDDEDDLFSDIAPPKVKEPVKQSVKNPSILESDDELFTVKSHVDIKNNEVVKETKTISPVTEDNSPKALNKNSNELNKSIFDSDEEIFGANANTPKAINITKEQNKVLSKANEIHINTKNNETKDNQNIFESDNELFSDKSNILKAGSSKVNNVAVTNIKNTNSTSAHIVSETGKKLGDKAIEVKKSIFDSDSDSDIFSNIKVVNKRNDNNNAVSSKKHEVLSVNEQIFENSLTSKLLDDTADKKSNTDKRKTVSLDSDTNENEDLFMSNKNINKPNVINQAQENENYVPNYVSSQTEILKQSDSIINSNSNLYTGETLVNKHHITDKNTDSFKEDTQLKNNIKILSDSICTAIDNNSNISNENVVNKKIDLLEDKNALKSESAKIESDNSQVEINDNCIKESLENSNLNDKESLDAEKNRNLNYESFKKSVEENTQSEETIEEKFQTTLNKADNNTNIVQNVDETNVLKYSVLEQPKQIEPNNNENKNSEFDHIHTSSRCSQAETVEQSQSPIFIGNKEKLLQTESKVDLFSDIFKEPPIFEKPKEPKKSQNINALFDDDSDDETLFFKKSEVVEEGIPDFSLDVNRDNLFGIFHDEPPAIDVDFAIKNKNYNVNSTLEDETRNLEINKDCVNDNIQIDTNIVHKDIHSSIIITSTFKKLLSEESIDDSTKTLNNNIPKSNIKTESNIFQPIHKSNDKAPNIHDLFSQDNDNNLLKSVNMSHSENSQKILETSEGTSKINNSEPDNSRTEYDNTNNSNLSIQDTDVLIYNENSDQLFKSELNKSVIVHEDEIDNLFRGQNKVSDIGISKNFDNLLKTDISVVPPSVKESKIGGDTQSSKSKNNFENMNRNEEIDHAILGQESKITTISHTESNTIKKYVSKLNEESLVKQDLINTDDPKYKPDKELTGSNKIGKLKAKMNIDVSKLLPGASPKKRVDKPKPIDQETTTSVLTMPTPLANKDALDKITKIFSKVEVEAIDSNISTLDYVEVNKNPLKLETSNDDPGTTEQKLMKINAFDKSGSSILDNTLSKERAKIQVKRRPSTRRARREAVRKSTIDDSTDNSSSLDDQPLSLEVDQYGVDKQEDLPLEKSDDVLPNVQKEPELQGENHTVPKIDNTINLQVESPEDKNLCPQKDMNLEENKESNMKAIETDSLTISPVNVPEQVDKPISQENKTIFIHKEIDRIEISEIITDTTDNMIKEQENVHREVVTSNSRDEASLLSQKDTNNSKESDLITKTSNKVAQEQPSFHRQSTSNKNVTSKVVYVLNDEDIFNTDVDIKKEPKIEKKTLESSVKPIPINTIGNVYKNESVKIHRKLKSSLFDEMSDDDDLFRKNKNTKKVTKKSVFDSDSDDDLFAGSRQEKKEMKDDSKKKIPFVRSSLFGDDDDDDLFRDRRKDSEVIRPTRPSTSRGSSSKPAFQDPLSALVNED